MSLAIWSEDMSVGVKEVDDQHKKMVKMINDLHDAMKNRRGKFENETVL